jgi:hypothetical protein
MRNTLAFLVFLAALSVQLAARAEPSSSDVELARGAFLQAERAFQEQRYEEALALFRLAFAKVPRDAVRFNLAVCLERLERYAEARSEYEAAAASSALSEAQRASAKQRAQDLVPRTAELLVTGVPDGVALTVDRRAACTAPCRVFVDPGARELVATLPQGPVSVRIEAVAGTAHAVVFEPQRPEPREPAPSRSSAAVPVALPRRESRPDRPGLSPGWLSVVGGVTAGVGAAGIVGFGLRTRALESDYHDAPRATTRDDGLRMQALTNVSIAVAGLGAALVALDLLETGAPRPLKATADGVRWSF